jgi:hypothetical protein
MRLAMFVCAELSDKGENEGRRIGSRMGIGGGMPYSRVSSGTGLASSVLPAPGRPIMRVS